MRVELWFEATCAGYGLRRKPLRRHMSGTHADPYRQNDIGPAGEGFVFRTVHGEAVAEAVEHRAQGQLRFRVAPADARHDLGTFLRCEDVGHG